MGAANFIWRSEANRADTAVSVHCPFNENPKNFISWFLIIDETWIYHFNSESKVQSMAWKYICFHLLVNVALSRQLAKLWRLCSWLLRELYWLSLMWQHYRRNLLCWFNQNSSCGTEGERWRKLICGILFQQVSAPVHTSSQALPAIWNSGCEWLAHLTRQT